MTRGITQSRRSGLSALDTVRRELVALEAMTVDELAAKYLALFGEPRHTRNKAYLKKHIAWRLQEQAEGGLSARALDRIKQLAPDAPARWRRAVAKTSADSTSEAAPEAKARDHRIPVDGTVLTRVYAGVEHTVTVRDGAFEYNGEAHRSLSGIARLITGKPWNGFVFFLGRTEGTAAGPNAGRDAR